MKFLSNRISFTNDLDELLSSLRTMTRWLEILGEVKYLQFIRNLIRKEVPGTFYVDEHDRENFILECKKSDYFRINVEPILTQIKEIAPARLQLLVHAAFEDKKRVQHRIE